MEKPSGEFPHKPENETLRCLAAKLNQEKYEWLPLWVHSLDTCGVAEKLFTEWIPDSACRAMAGELNQEDLNQAVRASAVLHDLGKASILFQTRITESSPVLRSHLIRNGLDFLSPGETSQLQTMHFPHAPAGEALLLMGGCPLSFAEVIGAHHGRPWPEGIDYADSLRETGTWRSPLASSLWGNREQMDAWKEIQSECLSWMLQVVNIPSAKALWVIPQSTAVLLTGLIIMADWIASNEDYFPLIPIGDTEPKDIESRLERGWKSLQLPSAWQPCPSDDWTLLCRKQFGFTPNAVQYAMMEAVHEGEETGLMILEAPMGLGKTEASLLAADLLAEQGSGGIFFGLPTQATANAIFSRIIQWGEQQATANQLSIRLAHGMADINQDYQTLMAGSSVSSVDTDGENEKERLIVHDWFRGRKQALLADFVVGTVDQVLMAALRQKHVMLRHLGLCGKVVIIDECHAYDAYMNQYLEGILRWLGAYHTPVIMLSATLPAGRRADFRSAYLNQSARARKRMNDEPWYHENAYPVLTWVDHGRILQKALPYDGSQKQVEIIRVKHDDSIEDQINKTVSILSESLQDGGCAAIVLNTVRRAQAFAVTLRKAMPDATVLLLHSRYVMPDRLLRENELLHRAGKKSSAAQRDRVIVVGTQVIEQSLDYDVDMMISDLCPMDLLMQRLGRLHRHAVHDSFRPTNLRMPKCYVLCAEDTLERGAAMIYGKYLLMRTNALLPEKITLPADISRLVNEVYDDDKPLKVEPEGYEQAREENWQRIDQLKRDAKAFCMQGPEQRFTNLLSGNIPDDEEHAKAQVRAGEMSLDVIILVQSSDGKISPLPWLNTGGEWEMDTCPSSKDARQILSYRIGLTNSLVRTIERDLGWDGLEKAISVPESWHSSSWFRNTHLLLLNQEMCAVLGNVTLKYDQGLGLLWERKG